MDNPPRSSKRRKLDTQKSIESTPLAKSSLVRASGRRTNRSVSHATGKTQEEVQEEEEEEEDDDNKATTPTRKRLPARRTTHTPNVSSNVTSGKNGPAVDKDVYDDIEGALSPTPKRKLRNSQSASHPLKRIQYTDTSTNGGASNKPHEAKTTPKRRKTNGGANGESARRSPRHGTDGILETEDELAGEGPTPSNKNKKALNGSVRKTASGRVAKTPKSVGRGSRTLAKAVEKEEEAKKSTNGTTPSKLRSIKKPSASMRKKAVNEVEEDVPSTSTHSRGTRRNTKASGLPSTIQDSGDELGDLPIPTKRDVKARRRMNRTDHFSNEDEHAIPVSGEEEQAEPGTDEDNEDDKDVDGGSLLGSVLDPTEPSPFNKPISAQKEKDKDVVPLLQANLTPGRELELLRTIIMERITAKRPAPLVGLDVEYKTVYQLIEQTITAGEGNSLLLIGARGSGKTALVNKVLSEMSKDNREDYHVVRLNGFIHTDDKIALREIWRQLGKEMDIEEDGGGLGKNYADTLTTLLALLSHPSEHTGEFTDQVARAVVFVMDEFDLFASHPRQTLLYNLFDIAQSRKAPIAVLGLTTRIDVVNSLEKRVKSRFSHRYVHLSLANSFTSFQELCKASLLIEHDQLSIEERGILCAAPPTYTYTPSKKAPKKPEKHVTLLKPDMLTEWNRNVSALFASKTFLTTFLAPQFYRTKSVPQVLTCFLLPTALLSPDTASLLPTSSLTPPDSKLFLVPSLSTLSLALLISAARLDIIHDSDTCNFNMAYDEYVTLASKARIQSAAGGASASGAVSKVWGKEVARREWEGLVELGLVVPVIGGGSGGFVMCKVDVALEEVGGVLAGEKGIDRSLERWCKQL
ncbi:hypothetical protein K504DRAFT_450770 [Pleomassaria siparia CBS 279.74]|uniref:Origin recognition complex subunit 4 n=1 Tax=Pleomassaria siparia CBS 279.74 TaxID=1314801 RepID=A0A6G1KMX5_9PLEO|nr:hypothetical protein K504DRAFT_450770 [Pleomassaria siparia CBS 279.74]